MAGLKGIALPRGSDYQLARARIPSSFLSALPSDSAADREGALLVDILIRDGRIAAIEAAGRTAPSDAAAVDLDGRQVWPMLVDMHAHLDKGHVIPRAVADGTFDRARSETVKDRALWSRADLERRMSFGLRCARVHGVAAIRTHLDSHEGMAEQSWAVFGALREQWSGRIALQGVSLVPIAVYRTDYGRRLADLVAASGGVLGGATTDIDQRDPAVAAETAAGLDALLHLAAERGLDVDLHVDQSADLAAFSLPSIARAVLRNRFAGQVVCDHCVNLALQPDAVARAAIALCADAGIAFATMPTPMLYLQDRAPGRTPRWRGVTLLHELAAAGIPVAIAGDNCRDAWFPYGDHDMLDTFQQAVRIFHLDHPFGDAPERVGPIPARLMRAPSLGSIAVGEPARLILFSARTINELMCRPQADRIVIDRGLRVTDELPDYAELDGAL